MKKTIFITLIAAFIISSLGIQAQGDVISADQASPIIKSKKVTIISARSETDYSKSHVSNAINIQHKDLYKSGDTEGLLKSPDELAKFFGEKGIPSNKMIIIYDDGKNKYAGRLYWTFKYLGVEDVKVLHKDMNEWKKARIMITRMPTKTKKATFTANPVTGIIATTNYVKAKLKDPNVIIVDVRTPAEYNGTSDKPESDGHIPGAINLNYETLLNDDGSLKGKAELEKLTSAAGLSPDKEVILYCKTSVRAGIIYLILDTILDFNNVKVYDGAYNEWVASANPVEK